MLSKWQIWDFFNSFKRDYLESFEGVLIINSFDPVCLKMMKDHLVQGVPEKIIHYKMASEVTKGWIEEEFQTLSLFAESESFFIHQAHDLKVEILDILQNLELSNRFLILSFETEAVSWKKIVKDNKVEILQIEAPKFWDTNKLLDFVCAYIRLPLSFEAKSWMLESLENNLGSFYNACSLIKLNNMNASEIGVEEVKELLTFERLDQFALASLYSRKKFRDFFDKLMLIETDFEKLRFFFNFLQSHLIKMIDTSYLNGKPRLTQYDKELQSTSKLWKSVELNNEVERFQRWELMCKKKDQLLWQELKVSHLRVQTPLS
jgi:hypothetical protein